MRILSCLDFVSLSIYMALRKVFCGAHINQMLQSLIRFLPVPMNDVLLKTGACNLAIMSIISFTSVVMDIWDCSNIDNPSPTVCNKKSISNELLTI